MVLLRHTDACHILKKKQMLPTRRSSAGKINKTDNIRGLEL